MEPIGFIEANAVLQKPASMTDEECGPLPIFRDGKRCISCWCPTWKERLSILWHGKVWLSVFSGNTQPPVWIKGEKIAFEI